MANPKVYFIADTHFCHANAVKFDHRPWETVEQMNEDMIRRWNHKVRKHDRVYILGDMVWKGGQTAIDLVKRLNGRKFLIRGNHDHVGEEFATYFEYVKGYDDIPVTLENGDKKRVILSHYFIPFYNAHRREAIMLHGHTHASEEHLFEEQIKRDLNANGIRCEAYNVGAMHQNYEPCTLDEILALHATKPEAGHKEEPVFDGTPYRKLYQMAKELQPHEAMQLVNEADSLEERKFFAAIANMVLQERQKEVIEKNLF